MTDSNQSDRRAAASDAAETSAPKEDVTLQYVILRRDLWAELDWPLGSVVAQACHAATAALWLSRDDPVAQAYCAPDNLEHMHKVGPFSMHARSGILLMCASPALLRPAASPHHPPPAQVVLEVKGEEQLRNVAAKLTEAGVRHKLWVEQPEDFPTCVATAPYPKSQVAPLLKKLKLCKWA